MNDLFLESRLLSDAGAVNAVSMRVEGKPAGFSMRRNGTAGLPEEINRREFLGAVGFDESSVARAEQVHGTNIARVSSPGVSPETDALVTDRGGLLLAISVADCVPILIFDRRKRIASAVHAGWRGTAGNITSKLVQYFYSEFGSAPDDIVAFVGPSAGACCYEVGEEVAGRFPEKFRRKGASRGKYFLDLKSANSDQLTDMGLARMNIEVSKHCTICNLNYHSFRRDGESSGRMMAAIAIG